MIGCIYQKIVDRLEEFRADLRFQGVQYYVKCVRKRRSCVVYVSLRNDQTLNCVLELRLKIRNATELGNLDELFESCRYFACGFRRSSSPEF